MKFVLSTLIVLSAAMAQAANVGTLRYTLGSASTSKSLVDCHGTIEVGMNIYSELVAYVAGNDNCTNVTIGGVKAKAEEGIFSGIRKAVIPLQVYDNQIADYDVRLASNSGKTSDRLTITVDSRRNNGGSGSKSVATLRPGQDVSLSSCGGSAQFQITKLGQANLIFRNVVSCSVFDILSNNGDDLQYSNKKLGGEDRNRGGSFTLPARFMDFGPNGVKVILRSNSGKTSETIRLTFYAI